ncbi:MAG: hypothetical protein IJP92_16430 [Lachnospiraceae bacterium]|nr:hypothetical protein [Lachnospiraceae bacterium]
MIEISEERLREIITRVVRAFLNETAGSASDGGADLAGAYVICAAGATEKCLRFLRAYKEQGGKRRLTCVLEDLNGQLRPLLREEGLCAEVIGAPDLSADGNGCSIYPSFSRTALAEAALGFDREFEACMLRRDFEAGRTVHVWAKGLTPFTGREPEAYRNLILSHIKTLAGMEVRFPTSAAGIDAVPGGSASGQAQDAPAPAGMGTGHVQIALPTRGNLVTAEDIKRVPRGGTVLLSASNVITPMAKDVIRDRRITVRYC